MHEAFQMINLFMANILFISKVNHLLEVVGRAREAQFQEGTFYFNNCKTVITPAKGDDVFGRVGLLVCLFVCPHDYLQGNERICMQLLSEVYKGWDDAGGSRGEGLQSLTDLSILLDIFYDYYKTHLWMPVSYAVSGTPVGTI